ncbi:unnamed protein product [Paramecium sonneborni]|uniref:Uncharacterized protein n=1 Tax=Paramecium sonneborni TaxID=65129 RepID=A0A8S1PXK2_9CILI|nr:unnamed protein product [Paramecium sonneborni]
MRYKYKFISKHIKIRPKKKAGLNIKKINYQGNLILYSTQKQTSQLYHLGSQDQYF